MVRACISCLVVGCYIYNLSSITIKVEVKLFKEKYKMLFVLYLLYLCGIIKKNVW
ncbi:unknown [Bacteroides sp. CAG:754]|nr:unknown [Bacteroides sp. CAG:754]